MSASVPIKTERQWFKRKVRSIVQHTPNDLTNIAFAATECPSIHRLASLNIQGHEACIRAKPCISDETAKMLTVQMFKIRAGRTVATARHLQRCMDDPMVNPPILQRRRLALNKPPPWRRSKDWPPSYSSRACRKTAFSTTVLEGEPMQKKARKTDAEELNAKGSKEQEEATQGERHKICDSDSQEDISE